jgi:hypothetical protein
MSINPSTSVYTPVEKRTERKIFNLTDRDNLFLLKNKTHTTIDKKIGKIRITKHELLSIAKKTIIFKIIDTIERNLRP